MCILSVLQTLKDLLKQSSLTAGIQVVVGDGDWSPADDFLRYPKFAASVDVIGSVYLCLLLTRSNCINAVGYYASDTL